MADAADSKSAAPCGRVGSTPISGTKTSPTPSEKTGRRPGWTALSVPREDPSHIFFLVWATSTRAAVLSVPSSV